MGHEKAQKAQNRRSKLSVCAFCAFLWLKMDDAALEGARRGLRAIRYTELSEDVVDMTLDGGFAYPQRTRDFFVALAVHDLLKHLELAQSQLRGAHAFR